MIEVSQKKTIKPAKRIGNGSLMLAASSYNHFQVWGGPYRERPADMCGVNLAEEIPLPADVRIPTRDFQVPDTALLDKGLYETVKLIVQGRPVYVGCYGGRGRTGLFLSILAKAFGETDPVIYVREYYFKEAVETPEQFKFVMNYRIPRKVKLLIGVHRLMCSMRKKGLLTEK